MSKRKQLDRERLEVYLLHLLLAYRPMIRISGLLLLGYAAAVTLVSYKAGIAALLLAVLVLVPSFSYPGMLYLARIGAWIGTLWMRED